MTVGQLSEKVKLFLTFAAGVIECLGFAGAIQGWPSLVFVLKEEDYFTDLCIPLYNSSDPGPNNSTVGCDPQGERFTLIFTIAVLTMNIACIASGALLDNCGIMPTRFLGIFLYTTGNLLIAFATAASALMLFPAIALIGMGGMLVLTTNIKAGNLFGRNRSTVITLYNGAFSTGAAVFLLVKVAFEAGFPLKSSFLFISCLSVLQILFTVFLLPWKHIPYPLPEGFTYGVKFQKFRLMRRRKETAPQRTPSLGAVRIEGNGEESREEMGRGSLFTETEEEVPTFWSCVFSRLFFTNLLWFSLIQLRIVIFFGALNPLLNLMLKGDTEQVSTFTNAFAIIQLFSIFCAPVNGLIMDRRKLRCRRLDSVSGSDSCSRLAEMEAAVLPLALTVTLSVLFSLTAAIPVPKLQYFTFVLIMINGGFLYGGFSAFQAITFPPCHFGKLYGTSLALGAVISLLQYPCLILINGPLQHNPLYMNIAFIALVTLAYAHPINVYFYCQRANSQRAV
ncbi:solute carrier family 43 member 3-like [Amblyraja radiata]|uniref:solute carrier family 43 member 3-like n=1 Tax=Amblyraja radiata TaxID=386614 RepID=UPI0014040F31|nr:solute carrier family 43 member 3-like [Amblyraja radiata]